MQKKCVKEFFSHGQNVTSEYPGVFTQRQPLAPSPQRQTPGQPRSGRESLCVWELGQEVKWGS